MILRQKLKIAILISTLSLLGVVSVYAQSQPDRKGAFVRSLVLPGWGHYYLGENNTNRGHLHLGGELTFIASYAGLVYRSDRLRMNYITLANLKAGINLSGRNRQFKIAVGEFDSIQSYNDYQLRTRNWHQLLEVTPENDWSWQNHSDRENYRNLRTRRDRIRNNLPAIIGLMALNRVVSAISSVNRMNHSQREIGELYFMPVTDPVHHQLTGITANLIITL